MPSAKGGSEVAAEEPRPDPAERGTHKRAGRKSRARSREIRLLFDQIRFLSVLGIQYTLKLAVDVFPGDRVRPADLTYPRDHGPGSPPCRPSRPGSSKACSVEAIGAGEAERAPPLSTER